ncbi:MAG: hypothetical protein ACRD0X_08410 [Thermoanaerobaculia bacterium]
MTRARGFWVWLGAVLAVGTLFFWYRWLEALANREAVPFAEPLITR